MSDSTMWICLDTRHDFYIPSDCRYRDHMDWAEVKMTPEDRIFIGDCLMNRTIHCESDPAPRVLDTEIAFVLEGDTLKIPSIAEYMLEHGEVCNTMILEIPMDLSFILTKM